MIEIMCSSHHSYFKSQLSTKHHPCGVNSSVNFSIIWVKAMDSSSTIHYLWTIYPVPTIVVAYTTKNDVEAEINCTALTNESTRSMGMRLTGHVNYTFAFVMPRIYEYDDEDDNVDLADNSYMVVHEFMNNNIKWDMDLDNYTSQVKFIANDSIILKVNFA